MSEPISVGDLVVIVKGGCSDHHIGRIFRVFRFSNKTTACKKCHTYHGYPPTTTLACPAETPGGFELARLKRIPPLSELEGEKQKEDLREPA